MAANAQWLMAIAISKVCQIYMHTATEKQKGMVMQCAKNLRQANIKPEQVMAFGEWWFKMDWRGKRGSPPLPHQIRTEWGKFKAWISVSPEDGLPVYT
jgi:hypothetical protein